MFPTLVVYIGSFGCVILACAKEIPTLCCRGDEKCFTACPENVPLTAARP